MTPKTLVSELWLERYRLKSEKNSQNCLLAINCDITATAFHSDDVILTMLDM